MSTTKTHSQTTTTEFPPLNQIGGKALDAVSAIAEANQRVVGQLIELSSSAAADRLRTSARCSRPRSRRPAACSRR